MVKRTRAYSSRGQKERKKAKIGNHIFYLTMSLFKLLFIKEKKKIPVGKSGILFLSLSPSVSVRVTGYYSVRFMEKKEGGNKIEREKGGVRERKRSSGSGKGNVTGSLAVW